MFLIMRALAEAVNSFEFVFRQRKEEHSPDCFETASTIRAWIGERANVI